jgi:hypothetical protein
MALTVKVHELMNIVDGNAEEKDVAVVAKVIQRTIQPQSWDVNGGDGTIAAVKPAHLDQWLLVILSEYNTEIEALLDQLRPPPIV